MTKKYKRPIFIKLLNLFLFPKEINFDELIRKAHKKYQMELPEKVQKYLKLFLNDIYQYNQFDSFGKTLLNIFIWENIHNLTYVEKNYKDIKIKDPVFIIGLPRTGSTFLHDYLSSTGIFRTLSFWELNKIGNYKHQLISKLMGKLMLIFQNYITPELKYIHKVKNNGPEECSKILLTTFITQIYPLMFKLPNYSKALDQESFDYTYDFYHKALTLIKNKRNKKLLLKAPMHLQAIDQIHHFFPDAQFINLHRDIKSIVPSSYSLGRVYSNLFTVTPNLSHQHKEILHRLSFDLNKYLEFRKSSKIKILDIHYASLIENKNLTLQKIANFLNIEINYIKENQDKDYKKHKYTKEIKESLDAFKDYEEFRVHLLKNNENQS